MLFPLLPLILGLSGSALAVPITISLGLDVRPGWPAPPTPTTRPGTPRPGTPLPPILGGLLLSLGTSPPSGAGCSSYTIINTRGTGEPQGPSSMSNTMTRTVLASRPGGVVYSTIYPADASQNSAAGTADILRQLSSGLSEDPKRCFILQGYSQGAAATVNALDQISASDPRFSAIKAVVLLGNPEHKAGLACNVDMEGGATTRNVNGLAVSGGGVPAAWVSKTLDICDKGDGVCDTTGGSGVIPQHLAYAWSTGAQRLGADFILARLGA